MKTENIVSLLTSTFEKKAWHGPAVKEVLADITPEQAFNRAGTSHSIIELIAHMTSWRIFVVKKLEGDFTYKVSDEINFPKATDWDNAVLELNESQVALLRTIQAFPASRLHDVVPNSSYGYSFYTLLHGIIHHDLYHIGQIVLIKKSK